MSQISQYVTCAEKRIEPASQQSANTRQSKLSSKRRLRLSGASLITRITQTGPDYAQRVAKMSQRFFWVLHCKT